MNAFLGLLMFFLSPPPPPPPSQPAPNNGLTAEQMAEYEAQYNACAGTWNPDQCRADLYQAYYG